MVELRDVSKRYGPTVALQPTTINFEPSKTAALIGPSGCGKSTMLRLILGLVDPTQGEVLLNGSPVRDWQSARRRMGFVAQDGGLFPHLTALQNVTLMAKHLKWGAERRDQRFKELCSLTSFSPDMASRYPAELSGGQRQRLSLMRALMLSPELLLLDEPLAALDPITRSSVQADLKEIFRQLSQTVIFVTHDMAEAAYLGDEIILIESGSVKQRGTLDDLRQRPSSEFVTRFINAQRSLVTL